MDATDEYGEPFRADFEGEFYYENVTEKSSVGPVEAYAVWYGAKEGTTYNNWYITLVDNGYLTTADAVGNYYYGNILRFDLLTGSDHLYTDGLPEGTFPVQASRSGEGIWGGEGADCTSFLTEYFSGIPARLQADRRRSDHYARSGELHDFFRRSRNVGRSDGAFRKL